jgi:hypothetical protein
MVITSPAMMMRAPCTGTPLMKMRPSAEASNSQRPDTDRSEASGGASTTAGASR